MPAGSGSRHERGGRYRGCMSEPAAPYLPSSASIAEIATLHRDLPGGLDWVMEARPEPDANQ